MVAFPQGNQDVRIGGADDAAGVVHGVDAAVRQAHIVDDVIELSGRDLAADELIDEIVKARGFLDAGTGFGAHVETELAVVAGGKEIAAEPGDEQHAAQAKAEENRDEDEPTVDEGGEQKL